MDNWLDSWHSVHTIVSVTDSLRKGRKEWEGSVEKCGTLGGCGHPRDLGAIAHLRPAHVSRGRRCAKVRTQKVLLPVNISAWRCSATLRSPSSDLISRLCTARGDVERRSLLASTKRETILASLGVTPGGSR